MRLPAKLQTILDRVLEGHAPSKEECVHLLKLPEDSLDAAATKAVADAVARKATFRIIRDTGLDFYYCCEPIGPEHRAEEMAEQMFLGIDYGCFQHAAMRRVYLPGAPLAYHGQITERRLAQVVAVVTLAALGCSETQSIAVHEPNLLGLAAGANTVYAETGANPRDVERDTTGHRGADMTVCRKMLYEAGFESLRRGDGTEIGLDIHCLQRRFDSLTGTP